MEQRRRQKTPSPLMIILLFELYKQFDRLPVKPPVTIGLIGINLFVHLHPNPYVFGMYLDDIGQHCIQPNKIVNALYYGHSILWNRLFLSSIIHANDMHLYYNMLSLSWKGINLEANVGSQQFFVMVVFSLLVSHTLLVVMAYILYTYIGWDEYNSGMNTCAVGFSAVLFSLKYIWNAHSPNQSHVMGIAVPTRYAAWLELIVTSMLTPNASFIGHLAGILAGVLYVHGPITPLVQIPIIIAEKCRLFFGTGRSGGGVADDVGGGGTAYYTYDDADYCTYQQQQQQAQQPEQSSRQGHRGNDTAGTTSTTGTTGTGATGATTAARERRENVEVEYTGSSYSSVSSGSSDAALSREELRQQRLHRYDQPAPSTTTRRYR